MPSCLAVSTDTIISRNLMVSSSISRRLIRMSPVITIPLSRIRSRMSARFAGSRFAGTPALVGATTPLEDALVISTAPGTVASTAWIAAYAVVGEQRSVLVDVGFVGCQDVRRRGDAAVLEHLDAHGPAVVGRFQRGDPEGGLARQIRDVMRGGVGGFGRG